MRILQFARRGELQAHLLGTLIQVKIKLKGTLIEILFSYLSVQKPAFQTSIDSEGEFMGTVAFPNQLPGALFKKQNSAAEFIAHCAARERTALSNYIHIQTHADFQRLMDNRPAAYSIFTKLHTHKRELHVDPGQTHYANYTHLDRIGSAFQPW